jgi:hypothetical protein
VNYFAVGHSSECFSFIKDWVEKKVRRQLAHAQKRKGFGWGRWSKATPNNTRIGCEWGGTAARFGDSGAVR